ncbi:hypothetical protein QA648_02765 [Rhizobium sp. CB3171]|uniref:hypothetical protein n=1 Tax=unclassified Rhizobium TaxID=2613769 RepID=UPI000CF25A5D|nr:MULTISPECIES: hypothetical protein [Rhizobium]MDK4738832.1 hypothetical protein [Rhizobium sp. CNPSo 3464]UWU21906.1 hypothetical protein N2601_02675 [Rhizobium tropici]WFU02723.1 hypothetical protein QA648_02765 [Rhizobium sp. CB3171]
MLIELFDRLLNASPNLGLLNICAAEILFLSLVYYAMWKLLHTQPFKFLTVYLKQEFQPQRTKRSRRSQLIYHAFGVFFFLMMAVCVYAASSVVLLVAAWHTGQKDVFPLQLLALGFFLLGLVVAGLMRNNAVQEWRSFHALLQNRKGGSL